MSLQEEIGLAGVDVEIGVNVVVWVPVVMVMNALPGDMVRKASPMSGATLEL